MRNFHKKKQVERQRLRKECVAIAEQIRATEQDIVHVRADLADHADELTFAQGEKSEILSKLEVSAALFFFWGGGDGAVRRIRHDHVVICLVCSFGFFRVEKNASKLLYYKCNKGRIKSSQHRSVLSVLPSSLPRSELRMRMVYHMLTCRTCVGMPYMLPFSCVFMVLFFSFFSRTHPLSSSILKKTPTKQK